MESEGILGNKHLISLDLSESDYVVNDACLDYEDDEALGWHQHVEQLHIAPGISLFIVDKPDGNAIISKFKVERSPLELAFCLKGCVASEISKKGYETQSIQVGHNQCSISYTPYCSGVSLIQNGGIYQAVSICVDIAVLRVLFERQMDYLSPDIMPILLEKDSALIYKIAKTPSVMHAAVYRIFSCRFSEPMRKLYISSKVYELINLMLAEFMLERRASHKSVLQPPDINRTITAGNLLKNNLENPPSVSELARRVSLSKTKLKSGFKEVYGTTIYGYLHHERMENAKTILDGGCTSVYQVAHMVGYVNVSHFISAFRKHFGVNPGRYLLDIKQSLVQRKMPNKSA